MLMFVCVESLCPSQQFCSHVAMGLPELNQYEAEDRVCCSRTQRSASSEAGTCNPSIVYNPFKTDGIFHLATYNEVKMVHYIS